VAARVIAAWGVVGVVALLLQAIWRLLPYSVEAVEVGLTTAQWAVLGAWVLFMAHAEGYRGFHRKFSPRVVARAMHLGEHPTSLRVALAPAYCMSLFGASKRGVTVARIVFVGIVALIVLVRQLDQPWRGIIDAGVVVGLGIGLISMLYFYVRALSGLPLPIAPDLPESEVPTSSGLPA
jgi:hypothetical protein